MGKLLPIILGLIGLGAGVGGGMMLRPDLAAELANPCGDVAGMEVHAEPDPAETEDLMHDYVKMNNQFVVPVVSDGRVSSLVILSISLEVGLGDSEKVYEREPKLRDAFLQVLFDHANAGGFDGAFTGSTNMSILRKALSETARKTIGQTATDVLIADIIRQDA